MATEPWDDLDTMAAHQVLVAGEPAWRRRLRLRQALWREANDIPIGSTRSRHSERPLGSRIELTAARAAMPNYLTETICQTVRDELAQQRTTGKLYGQPRIYDDLLSSQPLCFNLFAELRAEAEMVTATNMSRRLWPDRVDKVDRIEFEHSPGRGDPTYTGNRSAFDVYMEHTVPGGGRGFIGIEVKYHEDLRVGAAANRPRTDEVAAQSGAFEPAALGELRRPPLQQLWFDHLLALSMLQADTSWATGLFVLVHPDDNPRCHEIGRRYADTLQRPETFQAITLETVVDALAGVTEAAWVGAFADRYLRDQSARRA